MWSIWWVMAGCGRTSGSCGAAHPSTAVVFTPSFHDLAGSRAWLRLPNTLVARLAERTVVLTEHERRGVRAAYQPPRCARPSSRGA